jgi:hypothetical protein
VLPPSGVELRPAGPSPSRPGRRPSGLGQPTRGPRPTSADPVRARATALLPFHDADQVNGAVVNVRTTVPLPSSGLPARSGRDRAGRILAVGQPVTLRGADVWGGNQ